MAALGNVTRVIVVVKRPKVTLPPVSAPTPASQEKNQPLVKAK